MKQDSKKSVLSRMWGGVCKGFRWFSGQFGYGRKGVFARIVWGVFASSAAVFMLCLAVMMVVRTYGCYSRGQHWRYGREHSLNVQLAGDIYYHHANDGQGYVFDAAKKEKLLEDVQWIAPSVDDDSLVCFCDGSKRGFFNKNTGKVVVSPAYETAWVFSQGLAGVVENGIVKFIDRHGKVVIDTKIAYRNCRKLDFLFYDGYCVVPTEDGSGYGLMDRKGKLATTEPYDTISHCAGPARWCLRRDSMANVVDDSLRTVLPWTACLKCYMGEGTIDLIMPDHTIRKYDMDGTIINDFFVRDVKPLEYQTDEIEYMTKTYDDGGEFGTIDYHPKATANLRAYKVADGFMGLISADGQIVTKPLYKHIKAVGEDLYLCTFSNRDKVILNGEGSAVR